MQRFSTIKDDVSESALFRSRLFISVFIVIFLFLVILFRYAWLQIVEHDVYKTQSDRNRVHELPVAPKRGLIYDRNGVVLAENKPIYTLSLIKERIADLDQTLLDLQLLFDIDDAEIEKFSQRLKRRKPYQPVPLKYQLNEDEISRFAVNRFRLSGVEIEAQLKRSYPRNEDFTHVLGYVGRINAEESDQVDKIQYAATDHIGKLGLELEYEPILHGTVGSQNVETNARGRVLRVLEQRPAKPGVDLTLHIDARLQQYINQIMQGRRGSVVAIDPQTGGVLAMVSTPSYDPNPFVTGISSKQYDELRNSLDLPLFNRTLQGQYPPGSTVKPVMGLAGLYYRLITRNSRVLDQGWFQLNNDDRIYRDWKKGGHAETMDLFSSIEESCDIFFYDLAFKLGIDRIHEFSLLFGLGQLTGIDSPHERKGLLPSRQWKRETKNLPWFPGETINIGIGQGYMLATPMQLAVLTAAIATKGSVPVPQLVKKIGDQEITAKISTIDVAIKDSDWQQIIESMEAVVHGYKGTARSLSKNMRYRMAGKTGTAQVIGIAQDAEYDAETIAERQRDHALFIGFAPVEAPVVAVAVIVENGGSGSSTAAPIAKKVIDWVMQNKPLPKKSNETEFTADADLFTKTH